MTINGALLIKVAERIEAEPDSYDQGSWVSFGSTHGSWLHASEFTTRAAETMCGSTACIAGHALLGSGSYKARIYDNGRSIEAKLEEIGTGREVDRVAETARKALGFNYGESRWLFAGSWRPDDFDEDWDQRKVAYEVAKALRDIASGKKTVLQTGYHESPV